MLRDFLKHSKHYDISTALVKEIVSPEQTVVSAGVIYFSEDALRAEQERLKAQVVELPKPKEPASKIDWKELCKQNKARA
ncbi:hypothetical protein M3J09_000455 [Ascochyta lentis]